MNEGQFYDIDELIRQVSPTITDQGLMEEHIPEIHFFESDELLSSEANSVQIAENMSGEIQSGENPVEMENDDSHTIVEETHSNTEMTPVGSPCFDIPVQCRSLYDLRRYLANCSTLPVNFQPDMYSFSMECAHTDMMGYEDSNVLVRSHYEPGLWITINGLNTDIRASYKRFECNICHHFPRRPVQCAKCEEIFCSPCFEKSIDLCHSCVYERSICKCESVSPRCPNIHHILHKINYALRENYDAMFKIKCEFGCDENKDPQFMPPYFEADEHSVACPKRRCSLCSLFIARKRDVLFDSQLNSSRHSSVTLCLKEALTLAIHFCATELKRRHTDDKASTQDAAIMTDFNLKEENDYWKSKYTQSEREKSDFVKQNASLKVDLEFAKIVNRYRQQTNSPPIQQKPMIGNIYKLMVNVPGAKNGVRGVFVSDKEGELTPIVGSKERMKFRAIRNKMDPSKKEEDYVLVEVFAHVRSNQEKLVYQKNSFGTVLNLVPKDLFKKGTVTQFDVVKGLETSNPSCIIKPAPKRKKKPTLSSDPCTSTATSSTVSCETAV